MTRLSIYDSDGLATTKPDVYQGSGTKKLEVKRFDNLTGVTITGGGSGEIVTLNGEQWLKVTTVAGTLTEVQLTPTARATPIGPHLVWQYYLEDYTKIASLASFIGSSGYAGWIQVTNTMTGSSAFDRNGCGTIESNPYAKAISGSGFDFNTGTMGDCKLRIVPKAGEVAVVYLHSLFFLGRQRAKAVLGFDDNRPGISRTAASSVTLRGVSGSYTFKDILDSYGYKGTVWMVTGYLNGDTSASTGTLTYAELKTLVADGWDMQVQTNWNPIDSLQNGSTLLGPVGFADRTIASINTSTNVLTSSVAHGLPSAGTYGYPIVFTGTDLPAGISADTMYWARFVSSTTFKLYATEDDSLTDTDAISFTDEGTVANYAYHYGRASNDSSSILEDILKCKSEIQSNLGISARFIAYNQGAVDDYVESAARSAGMLIARTTGGQTFFKSSYMFDDAVEQAIYPHEHLYTVQLDEAAARSTAYYIALIKNAVNAGLCIHSYCHDGSTTTNQNLANFCEALYYFENLGMLDVKTMTQYFDERFTGKTRA